MCAHGNSTEILSWLRRRRERSRRIDADSDMLIRELGSEAYSEARIMQRRANSTDERRKWRDVALAVARETGKRVGLDTATRMARDASEPQSPKLDPIDELKRLIRDRG